MKALSHSYDIFQFYVVFLNGGAIMLLVASLSALLKGNIICRVVSVILLALGVLEVYLGTKYSKNVIHKGTTNGFAPLSMATSLYIGIGLIVIGVIFLVLTF